MEVDWSTSPACDTWVLLVSKQGQSAKQSLAWDVEISNGPWWHHFNVVSFQTFGTLYLIQIYWNENINSLYFVVLICVRSPTQSQPAISPFWFYYCFRLPRFENELSIVVAVHAEVEEDLAGSWDKDGGANNAPVHAGQEEQEHGKGREGEPGVEVERGQEGHRGSRRVLRESRYEGDGYLI